MPGSVDRVYGAVTIDIDPKGNEVRVSRYGLSDDGGVEVFHSVRMKRYFDRRPDVLLVWYRLQVVLLASSVHPPVTDIRTEFPGEYLGLVRHHKRREDANAELPDRTPRLSLVAGFEERADGPEQLLGII